MKADEVQAAAGRRPWATTPACSAPPPRRCGQASRGGGTLLALGNGGSATDAMDAVADFVAPRRPAARIDLTADTAIITAIANDIGTEAIFSRQVIAYGRPGDVLLALSTSGNSRKRDRRAGARLGAGSW